ncbi:hypothetical protein GJAV_G00227230 [Gymnothorax javanicus]|nr:hypothetical protein GJAV_G00227230 [Gymnothorax javanicus]
MAAHFASSTGTKRHSVRGNCHTSPNQRKRVFTQRLSSGSTFTCWKSCALPGQTLAHHGRGLALMDVVTDGSRNGSTNRPILQSTGNRKPHFPPTASGHNN